MADQSQTICVGIDILTGRRPVTSVALDASMRLLAIGRGAIEDALAYVAGLKQAVVAINAPSHLNCGLASQAGAQPQLPGLPARRGRNLRRVELELLQQGVSVARTPDDEADCPEWMRRGFSLYRYLDELGYTLYVAPLDGRQWIETHPDAAYWSLLEKPPVDGGLLEGRLQRQLLLFNQGLPVADPMDFFEEVTRHKVLQGTLPFQNTLSTGELNAWVAAYTAWLAAHRPEQLHRMGDPQEGQIFLPLPADEKATRRPLHELHFPNRS
jgi:predicted nuclease with RNAse H fold